jgi:hypothetical protein
MSISSFEIISERASVAQTQKSLKERALHAGIFGLFPIWLQNSMNGLYRLARSICEIHVRPRTSAEIRQNVPSKLSKLLSSGTDFDACKESSSTAVILCYSLLFTITCRYVIHRQLEIIEGAANRELNMIEQATTACG